MTELGLGFIIMQEYSINTVQYPTGKTKKEGTDSLTLVNVFILYTHCHKYRIYFYPEVPTTKSQGWVPTKHTTVTEGALTSRSHQPRGSH